MEWEFLGTQRMRNGAQRRGGFTYLLEMWRTKVPGGWLVTALNARSQSPQPAISFYPDPEHRWQGALDVEAAHLLRPAAAPAAIPEDHLLRASGAIEADEELDTKRLT